MSDNRENIKQKKRILEQGFLNGFDVYRALEAGINNILPYQDKLDEINVFPVPDGAQNAMQFPFFSIMFPYFLHQVYFYDQLRLN